MGKLHKLVASTAVLTTVAVGFTALADADTHVVKSGDTLWRIAVNNGTTVDKLMKDNNLTSTLIFPGDQLYFERVAEQKVQAETTGQYKVVLGDTLYRIANNFGTTVDNLVALNKIANPNFISVGQVLTVSGQAPAAEVKKEEVKVAETPVVAVEKAEVKVAETPVVEVKKEEVKPAAAPVAQQAAPAPAAKTQAPVAAQPVAATSNKAAAIYAAARAQVGVFQDCTMLVTNALRSVGINYHNWPAGYLSLGTVVPASQAMPGDLIYYANGGMGLAHIAVYAGNGQAVHGGWFGNQTAVATAYVGSGPVFIRVA